jgi:Beta-ketoacyl synthase, N-terminal domain
LLASVREDGMSARSTAVWIEAVGIAAPGLPSWEAARDVLTGATAYVPNELPPHAPQLLPPNERRRATPTVRIAFQASEDAVRGTSIEPSELATVFASSDADLNIIHRISTALAQSPRLISPTDFHNSVHNAAAGYWSIAVGARAPSATISAYDFSFAAGLEESCNLVRVDGVNTLLVAFDLPPPQPLLEKRPIGCIAAVALILTGSQTARSLASIASTPANERPTPCSSPALDDLRRSNPATAALPLLELLACRRSGRVILPRSEVSGLAVQLDVVDAR